MSKRSPSKRYIDQLGTPITPNIHQAGYDLWCSGLQEKRCRTQLGLTSRQWKWLRSEGNRRFPSYESMRIDEVAALRTEARNAAKQFSTEGVEALRLRVENARAANAITQGILRMTVDQLRAGSEDGEPFVLESALPSRHVLEMLKVLEKIGDLGSTAESFRRIYGDVPVHKGLYPQRDALSADTVEAQPFEQVQGGDAERGEFLDDEAVGQIVDDLRDLTVDELRAFVDGGPEPVPDRSRTRH